MWHELKNDKDAEQFRQAVWSFHDSCIKEIKYINGFYVNKKYVTHPMNDQRKLIMKVHRRVDSSSVIELEFTGITFMRFLPDDGKYSCEILKSKFFFSRGVVSWCDNDKAENFEEAAELSRTVIVAGKVRWRTVNSRVSSDTVKDS